MYVTSLSFLPALWEITETFYIEKFNEVHFLYNQVSKTASAFTERFIKYVTSNITYILVKLKKNPPRI